MDLNKEKSKIRLQPVKGNLVLKVALNRLKATESMVYMKIHTLEIEKQNCILKKFNSYKELPEDSIFKLL